MSDEHEEVAVAEEPALTPEILEQIVSVPAVEPVETEDGFLVNPENGEVVGHVNDRLDRPFTIDNDDAAEWALKLLHSLEGEVAGLQARRDSLLAQMDSIIRERAKKIAWWHFRFEPDVKRYARTKLKGKSKTVKFPWASVQFRENPGSNVIVSDEEALAYVETFAPELVKVKRWVGVTEILKAAAKAEEVLGEPQDSLGFMKHTGSSESVTIKTGIFIEGGKKK